MHLLRNLHRRRSRWPVPELQGRIAGQTKADGKTRLSLAFLDLAAQRTIFLFETGYVAADQQLCLVNPVIAANAAGKCAELGINLGNVGC